MSYYLAHGFLMSAKEYVVLCSSKGIIFHFYRIGQFQDCEMLAENYGPLASELTYYHTHGSNPSGI